MSENQPDTNFHNNASIMITGGSGMIGRYLTSSLLSEGYKVSHLSRNTNQFGRVRVFRWDPEKGILDPIAFDGVDYIIHLAGANIGEKRWTKDRKEEIISSRIKSVTLLHNVITSNQINIKAFISASAAGYYGSLTSEKVFSEVDPPGNDFPGTTCRLWEEGAGLFQKSGIRTVKIRTAVVLEKNDSALSKMMMPAKSGFLVQTGDGRQYMPWIHIKDLCNIYRKAIEDEKMNGAYNAVSPSFATQKEFITTLGRVMKKPVFPVSVPSFALRLALGEMSDVVLKGSRVSSEKIVNAGYSFIFSNLHDALNDVLNN